MATTVAIHKEWALVLKKLRTADTENQNQLYTNLKLTSVLAEADASSCPNSQACSDCRGGSLWQGSGAACPAGAFRVHCPHSLVSKAASLSRY